MVAYGWGGPGIHKREILPACEARAEHAHPSEVGSGGWEKGVWRREERGSTSIAEAGTPTVLRLYGRPSGARICWATRQPEHTPRC